MGYKKDAWLEEELEIIRKYFPNYGVKKCEELIPRHSAHAIAKKAQYIGVKLNITQSRINSGVKKINTPTGFVRSSSGHVLITDKTTGKRRLYHRWLMEKFIGRKLEVTEIIHHIDGDRLNNMIDNLCIVSRSEHIRIHKNDIQKARLKKI